MESRDRLNYDQRLADLEQSLIETFTMHQPHDAVIQRPRPAKLEDHYKTIIDYSDIDSVADDEEDTEEPRYTESFIESREPRSLLTTDNLYKEGAFKLRKTGGEEIVCYSELFAPLPATRACYEKQHLIQHNCKTDSLADYHKYLRNKAEFMNELKVLYSIIRDADLKSPPCPLRPSFFRAEAEYETRWLVKRLRELNRELQEEEQLPKEAPYTQVNVDNLHLWPILDLDITASIIWEGPVSRSAEQSHPSKVLKFDDGGNIIHYPKATLASHTRPVVVNRKEDEDAKVAEASAPRETLSLFLSSLISSKSFETAPTADSLQISREPISFTFDVIKRPPRKPGMFEKAATNPLICDEFGKHWGELPQFPLKIEPANRPAIFNESAEGASLDLRSRINTRFTSNEWEHLIFLDRSHSLHHKYSKFVFNLADPFMHFTWPDRLSGLSVQGDSEDGTSEQYTHYSQEQRPRRNDMGDLEDWKDAQSFLSEDITRIGVKVGTHTDRVYKNEAATLKHAKPAYDAVFLKTNWTENELCNSHRPSLAYALRREQSTFRWRVRVIAEERTTLETCEAETEHSTSAELFKLQKHLSLRDGKFVLFEYIERQPPLLNSFAMASRLKRYFRNLRPEDAELYVGTLGLPVHLDEANKLPLIAQLQDHQGLAVLETNLSRAPVYSTNASPTDFVLIRCLSSKGRAKFYLRGIDHLYSAGQTEPKVEVFTPKSRNTILFQQHRIQAYIYNFLNNNDNKVKLHDIALAFPNLNESIIKKNLKSANCEQTKDLSWTCPQLPNEQEVRELITPEKVCQFESMLVGQLSLHNRGITLTSTEKLSTAVQRLKIETEDPRTAYLAGYIEDEVITTPWNLTSSYIATKQSKGMMRIEGVGDPTHGNCGYSFARLPMKLPQFDKTSIPDHTQPQAASHSFHGSDADFRRLPMDEVKKKLIQLGCPEDRVESLPRWDRIALLRNLSTQAVSEGKEGNIAKYARGMRITAKMQREEYQQTINDILQRQMSLLGTPKEYAEHYSSDTEDENIANELTSFMLNPPKPSDTRVINFADDEAREEQFQLELLRREKLLMLQGDRTPEAVLTIAGKKQVVRRVTRMRKLDGSVTERTEYLATAADVREYLERQEEKHRQTLIKADRMKKTANTIEQKLHPGLELKHRNLEGEEARKLLEEKHRLEELQEYSKNCITKLETGQSPAEGGNKFVCGKCGLVGHMRTNRKRCPMYSSEKVEPSQPEKDGSVKAEGFKLSFSLESISKLPSKKKEERRPFTADYLKPRAQPKKRRTFEVDPFEDIAFCLMRFDKTRIFIAPVMRELVQDYYDIVQNPIDLETMRTKAKRGEYASAKAFKADLDLLVHNTHLYNGPSHEISQQARLIHEEGMRLLKERELLSEAPEDAMDIE